MKTSFADLFFNVIIFAALACSFYLIFHTADSMPVVYWSHSEDRCVKVIVKDVECSCSELPDKYQRIWVK